MQVLHVTTSDDLRLQGIYYPSKTKDTCLVWTHGMSGNFIENVYADVLGKTLSQNDIGYIYGHNRGHSHINDTATSQFDLKTGYKSKRIGATYERFVECKYDIKAWIQMAQSLGYKKIILGGHSLGATKVIYYLSCNKDKNIIGTILSSPADMVGHLINTSYYNDLLKEAKKNLKEGNPRKILDQHMVWDWYNLSSQTFLDMFEIGGPADVFPVVKNPETYLEFSKIDVPTLCIFAEFDDVIVNSANKDLETIKSKAKNAPSFDCQIIENTDHNYQNKEKVLAQVILDWTKKI